MPHYFHIATGTMYQNTGTCQFPQKSCCLDGIYVKLLLALVSSNGGNGDKYSSTVDGNEEKNMYT